MFLLLPQSKRSLPALCVSLIQADASYFRIDLPNSGMVILDKPLDYETKTQLQVVIVAVVRETSLNRLHMMCLKGIRIKEGQFELPFLLFKSTGNDNERKVQHNGYGHCECSRR